MRKSILFLTGAFSVGGATTYLCKKVKWLLDHNWEVAIAAPDGPGRIFLDARAHYYCVNEVAETLYLGNIAYAVASLSQLSIVIQRHNVAIIETHCQHSTEHGELASRVFDLPLNVVSLSFQYARKRYINWVKKWILEGRFQSVSSAELAAVSKAVQVQIPSWCHIRIPVEITPALPDDQVSAAALRTQWGIMQDTPIVLTVARLDADKAYIQYLITQFAKDDFGVAPLTLVIVGDGVERKRLETLANRLQFILTKQHKRIIFVGTKINLKPFYQMANIYVGQGTTSIEAAATGLPVILATVSPKQMVSIGYFGADEGYSMGDVLPINQGVSYSKAINYLLSNPEEAKAIGAYGQFIAQEHFSVDKVMEKQAAIYEKIVHDWQQCPAKDNQPWDFTPDNYFVYVIRYFWTRQSHWFRGQVGILLDTLKQTIRKLQGQLS